MKIRARARAGVIAAAVVAAAASPAAAHFKPGTHNAIHAINLTWCGKANVDRRGWRNEAACRKAREAIRVAKCEAASWWTNGIPTQARNGQFRGMFQMGTSERALYGHGLDPWSQARAAWRYWASSGRDWSPWQCTPWGYLNW